MSMGSQMASIPSEEEQQKYKPSFPSQRPSGELTERDVRKMQELEKRKRQTEYNRLAVELLNELTKLGYMEKKGVITDVQKSMTSEVSVNDFVRKVLRRE